jgi:hypothetical protein
MSKTEKTEISDLRRYMEQSLAEHYTQVITFKDREDSFVSLYAHKDTGQKVLLRRSGNRNDGVYRALRGKRLFSLCPAVSLVALPSPSPPLVRCR